MLQPPEWRIQATDEFEEDFAELSSGANRLAEFRESCPIAATSSGCELTERLTGVASEIAPSRPKRESAPKRCAYGSSRLQFAALGHGLAREIEFAVSGASEASAEGRRKRAALSHQQLSRTLRLPAHCLDYGEVDEHIRGVTEVVSTQGRAHESRGASGRTG